MILHFFFLAFACILHQGIYAKKEYDNEADRRGGAYIDELLHDMFGNRADYDPYKIEDSVIGFNKKVLFVNVSGEAKLHDGFIKGLSTLYRPNLCSLSEDGDRLLVKADLGAGQLDFSYAGSVKFMNFGPTITVHGILPYIEVHIEFTVDPKSGKEGKLEKFIIDDMRGMNVWVTGLGPLNWAVNPIISRVTSIFKRFVRNFMEHKVEKHIAERIPNFKFPVSDRPVTNKTEGTHPVQSNKTIQENRETIKMPERMNESDLETIEEEFEHTREEEHESTLNEKQETTSETELNTSKEELKHTREKDHESTLKENLETCELELETTKEDLEHTREKEHESTSKEKLETSELELETTKEDLEHTREKEHESTPKEKLETSELELETTKEDLEHTREKEHESTPKEKLEASELELETTKEDLEHTPEKEHESTLKEMLETSNGPERVPISEEELENKNVPEPGQSSAELDQKQPKSKRSSNEQLENQPELEHCSKDQLMKEQGPKKMKAKLKIKDESVLPESDIESDESDKKASELHSDGNETSSSSELPNDAAEALAHLDESYKAEDLPEDANESV